MAEEIKKGYTIIPTYILETIFSRNFSKRQIKVLLFMLRFSFGCGSFETTLNSCDFRLTGLRTNVVSVELRKLKELKVIRGIAGSKRVAINPVIGEWIIEQNSLIPGGELSNLVSSLVSKQLRQKTKTVPQKLVLDSEVEANSTLKDILKIFNKNSGIYRRKELEASRRELYEHFKFPR